VVIGTILFCGGLSLVALVLADIFQSVVLPRPANRLLRLSALLSRLAWRGLTRVDSRFASSTRTTVLGVYASFMLAVFLVSWVVALVAGYGLMFFALRSQVAPHLATFGEALYFAGTTFLTIGYGDFHPISAATRVLSVVAGATGFAVIAVVATFLFSILGGFQQREFFIATVSQRVDATPTGLSLLLTVDRSHRYDDLTTLFRDARRWIAAVTESHLAYPILAYFRSTREDDSWVSTLAAVMDAAALIICFVESDAEHEAARTLMAGQRLVDTFVAYFGMRASLEMAQPSASFASVRGALEDAGYALRDATLTRHDFESIQRAYRGKLESMSRYWLLPSVQWPDEAAVAAAIEAAESVARRYGLGGRTSERVPQR